MITNGNTPVTIRQARSEDVEPILDLLTEYDLPRSYFEPFYRNDSSYRPEQSWVVEQNGRLVSHLRIFDRWIRVERATLHIAGIGNVITAKGARGHGYVGQIISAMLPVLQQEGYAYALLWTHLFSLYGRYGWVPLEQEEVRWMQGATLSVSMLDSVSIAPFREQDLPAVMSFYESTNAQRTGTTIRSNEYWQEQLVSLYNYHDNFLVAHNNAQHALVGYVRSRAAQHTVEVLELGIAADGADIGRALLAAISAQHAQHNHRLQGQFPPSQSGVFVQGAFEIVSKPGLMGRVINPAKLVHALESLWLHRVQQAGKSEASFSLSTRAGRLTINVRNGLLQMEELHDVERVQPLNESEFAHLLFHGFDEHAHALFGHRSDASCLHLLFPAQDFVIWQADSF